MSSVAYCTGEMVVVSFLTEHGTHWVGSKELYPTLHIAQRQAPYMPSNYM